MRYIKPYHFNESLFDEFIHPYFPEVLQCVVNSYESNLEELREEINELSDIDEWGEFIYSCLNDDDKKDFGKLFIKEYFDGDGLRKLVDYLKEKLKEYIIT